MPGLWPQPAPLLLPPRRARAHTRTTLTPCACGGVQRREPSPPHPVRLPSDGGRGGCEPRTAPAWKTMTSSPRNMHPGTPPGDRWVDWNGSVTRRDSGHRNAARTLGRNGLFCRGCPEELRGGRGTASEGRLGTGVRAGEEGRAPGRRKGSGVIHSRSSRRRACRGNGVGREGKPVWLRWEVGDFTASTRARRPSHRGRRAAQTPGGDSDGEEGGTDLRAGAGGEW